jgi:hypothetical protein
MGDRASIACLDAWQLGTMRVRLRAVPTVTFGNKPTVSIDNTPRVGEEKPDHAPVMVEFGI